MADYRFDPQREFALFAEDARLGRLHTFGQRRRTYKFDRDPAVPVFHFQGEAALMIASLHLPFLECAFMYDFPPNWAGVLNNRLSSTVWIVWEQESPEGITGTLFFRHPERMRAYGLNTAQFTIRPIDTAVATDPDLHLDPNDNQIVEFAAHARAMSVLEHTAPLTQPTSGTVDPMNKATDDANVRRARINLPPLSRVRTIQLHPPEARAPTQPVGRGKGVPHAPRWTCSYFRRTGKWVAPYATRNLRGKDPPPPWYNLE